MIRNYNLLSGSRDTRLKNQSVIDVDISPTSITSKSKKTSAYVGWLIAFLLMFGLGANAQVNGYVFSQTTGGSYTPLSGARTILFTATAGATADPGLGDDRNFTLAAGTIPFTFTFNGVPYTGVNINTNGYLTFGATLPTTSDRNGMTNTTAWNASIVAMGRDLSANNNATTLGEISYEILGSGTNRQFVIQYAKFRRFSSSTTVTEDFNFQIVLNEANGVAANQTVNIIYGTNTTTSTSTVASSQALVGLRGATVADFANRTQTTGWDLSTAGATNTTSISMRHSTTIFPASGLKFTWTPPIPPACPLPALVTITALSSTTAQVSWTGAPSAVVEWGASGCVAGTGAAAGTCANILTGSSPQIITGLAFGTAYSVHVRQNCTGSGNGYSNNVTTAYTHTGGENCNLAVPVTVAPNLAGATNTLLTMGQTSDGPNGTCSDATGNPSKKDTWAKFVAPSNGNKIVIATSAGSLTDCVMQVWSSCPATGVALGCNDDTATSTSPTLEFCQNQYVAGQTYYVQVWPYSATSTGTINIKIYEDTSCPLPPPNDDCAGIVTLTVGAAGTCPAASVSGTTVNATSTSGLPKTTCDPFASYYDVVYKFNSGSNTDFNFTFTNLTGVNKYGFYTACGAAGTYLGVCGTASTTIPITGAALNTDYYIVIYATSPADQGTFSLCLSANPIPACVASPTSPANGATGVSGCPTVTLSWPAVTYAASYDVYLNAGAGPATTLVGNVTTTSFTTSGSLAYSSGYSWRVIPKNASGAASGCSDFTFTTAAQAPAPTVSPASPVTIACGGPAALISVGNSYTNTPPSGECLQNGNGQWPSSAVSATTCDGSTANVCATNCYAGEYSLVNVSSSSLYVFSSSISGDFVTITSGDGSVTYAYGPSPVTWYNNVAATQVRFHTELASCTTDAVDRTRSFTCLGNPVAVFSPATGLFTDSGATIAYNGVTPVSSVYALPASNQTYSVTTYSGTCGSIPASITVNRGSCASIVNLKLYVEGYYQGAGVMRPVGVNQGTSGNSADVENITVELHNASSPYAMVATTTAMLKTNGVAQATFNTAPTGSFYIVVKTRNTVDTWSATSQTVGSTPLTYDFSSAASQAFGGNQASLAGGVFALYSGDIDPSHDGNIDTIDYPVWETDSNNFESGNFHTDLNGDGNVDTIDYPIWENNSNNFISVVKP